MNFKRRDKLKKYYVALTKEEIIFLMGWLEEDLIIDKKIDKSLTNKTGCHMEDIIKELKDIKENSLSFNK
jgi:hypothetical protein